MNRQETKAFINDLIKIRDSITDDAALIATAIYPQWRENEEHYVVGQRVLYNNILYKVLTDHISQTDWTPEVSHSLFAKVLTSDAGEILPWEQPSSTNPYMIGDRVIHNDYIWESTVDNNVWEPSVYGWEQISEIEISDSEALSIIAGGVES